MYSPETSAERKKELTVFKCVRVPDFEDDIDAPIIVDKRGMDWNARADYTDEEVMVTGSGDDPMFYFNRHAVIVDDDAPAPVMAPAPMKFMQGLTQAVDNAVRKFETQRVVPNKGGASKGKKAKNSKGKKGASKGKSKGVSKGKAKGASKCKAKGASKGKAKGSKKFKSSTNETKAELVASGLRNCWLA